MGKAAQAVVYGFFFVIALAIVFVKAGANGTSGGQQTAAILKAGGASVSDLASALEGN